MFQYDIRANIWKEVHIGNVTNDFIDVMPKNARLTCSQSTPLMDGRTLICNLASKPEYHNAVIFTPSRFTRMSSRSITGPPPTSAEAAADLAFHVLPFQVAQHLCVEDSSLVTLHDGRVLRIGGLVIRAPNRGCQS
jgi:hypothetical protein